MCACVYVAWVSGTACYASRAREPLTAGNRSRCDAYFAVPDAGRQPEGRTSEERTHTHARDATHATPRVDAGARC